MLKKSLVLPFVAFAVIALVFAFADFIFLVVAYMNTSFIWKYPSMESTILGVLWFGEALAAILTPVVLCYWFRVRQLRILLPWMILAVPVAFYLVMNTFTFIQTPFDPLEIVWRSFHMPMTSLQTMTFATDRDYFSGFIVLQVMLGILFGIGHLASFALLRKRPR